MTKFIRRAWLLGLVLLSMFVGMIGGVFLDRQSMVAAASEQEPRIDLHLISEAWDLVQRHYVDRTAVQAKDLTYGAISGMVDSLGDTGHSGFMTPAMVKQARDFQAGSFVGIGIEVGLEDGRVAISAPMDDSPAQRAGLRAGDVILKVDGQDMSGLSINQVVAHIAGQAGTPVTLTLQDPQSSLTRDVRLIRARIVIPAVTWLMLPGTTVAHIRIAAFSERTSVQIQQALEGITQAGASGIILDLRNNPGGLLEESVSVASHFLAEGNVLLKRDATGRTRPIAVRTELSRTDLPIVLLVNYGTASAAEIVSGALQDAHRATLLGETTFGTGTVLNQFSLSDGSALMLAVDEWLTPNGRTIWHQGITPDLPVSLDPKTPPLTPRAERKLTAAEFRASGDTQLLAALDLLMGTTTRQAPPFWFRVQ